MKISISLGLFFSCFYGFSQTTSLNVYFVSDKYELTEAAKMKLDSFVQHETVSAFDFTIELNGYCDATASDRYNDLLSLRRVTRVKNYLLSKGIKVGTITKTQAFGEKRSLNDNSTDGEKQLNRRVEIIVNHSSSLIDSPKEENSLKRQIADSSIISGSTITLRNINFYGGTHIVMQESFPVIRELLEVMNSYPDLVIEIHGHICCQPGSGDGLDLDTRLTNLSGARAKAIHDYLLANGIDADRVSYKGLGHSQPLYSYPEANEYQRMANRRVEIKIIRK